jgi:SNF2 family DNA or RNA helicase
MQLETLIAGKHKTLIFSSFVKHLHVFARECDAQGWKYSMLTGATTNREKVIQEFRDNEDISVFLISLKAGGTGLNLTEADYVFLLDPWWNPAAERQAISRAHRIGQDKSVFAYKYITRDTVEERILQLQEKKLHLADTFIQTGNPLKDLNEEESLWLFS